MITSCYFRCQSVKNRIQPGHPLSGIRRANGNHLHLMLFDSAPAPGSAQRIPVKQAQESIASEAPQTEARRCSPPLLIAGQEHIGPQGFVALLHWPVPRQEPNHVQAPRSGRIFLEYCKPIHFSRFF